MKHLSADDSGCTSVKVGHRQALTPQTPSRDRVWGFVFGRLVYVRRLFMRPSGKHEGLFIP